MTFQQPVLPPLQHRRVNVPQPQAIESAEVLSSYRAAGIESAFTDAPPIVRLPIGAVELTERHSGVAANGGLGEVSHIRIVGGFRVLLGLVAAPPVAYALTLRIGAEVRHKIPRTVTFVAVYVTRFGHHAPPRGQRR